MEITPKVKQDLWERFQEDAPKRGSIQDWYDERAAELGVGEATVRSWIARERERTMLSSPDSRASAWQLIASEIDLTAADAMIALRDALGAEKQIIVRNRDGEVIDEIKVVDHKTRVLAAEKVLKFHNAMGPDVIEIRDGDAIDKLSDEELDELIERKKKEK